MTKILNLDDIEQSEDKSVVLAGQTHVFRPFTVAEFIAQLKEIEAIEKTGEMTVADYAEFSIKTVKRAFPTIPEEQLRDLSINKLKALTDFVREVASDEADKGAEATGTEGNGEGKAS